MKTTRQKVSQLHQIQGLCRRIMCCCSKRSLFGPAGPESAEEWQYRPVGGGSINTAFKVSTKEGGQWFCKFNNAFEFPHLFVREASGLALIRRQGLLRVPATVAGLIGNKTPGHFQRLDRYLPEFLPPEPTSTWEIFYTPFSAFN